MMEAGVKDYDVALWIAYVTPAGTPDAIVGQAQPRDERHPEGARHRREPAKAGLRARSRPARTRSPSASAPKPRNGARWWPRPASSRSRSRSSPARRPPCYEALTRVSLKGPAMPTGTIDSAIFKDIFGTEAMRQVWSDGNRIQKYLDFEAGLARAQAQAEDHPAGGLRRNPQARQGRPVRHREAEEGDRAHRLSGAAGGGAARRSSARTASANGATGAPPRRTSPTPRPSCRSARASRSSRRTSTTSPTRSPRSPRNTATRRWPAAATCSRRCRSPSATRCATYLAAFERHKQRLKQLKERVFVFEFGGAAGTLSSLGKDGLRTQVELAKELEPRPAGDRLAHRARPHRRGRLLPRPRHRHLRQDRLRREADDADRGGGGVRAVPRGPRLVLDHAAEAQPDLLRLHHRADRRGPHARWWRCSTPWSRTTSAPPASGRSSGSCCRRFSCSPPAAWRRPSSWSRGLQVDEKRMRANLDITKGLIVSEAVMMGLGPHLGRQYAHDLVYDICRKVVATGRPLADLLAENEEIAKHMSKAELAKLCDPANYLGQAGEMVDRVLALRQRRDAAAGQAASLRGEVPCAASAASRRLTSSAVCAFLSSNPGCRVSHECFRRIHRQRAARRGVQDAARPEFLRPLRRRRAAT